MLFLLGSGLQLPHEGGGGNTAQAAGKHPHPSREAFAARGSLSNRCRSLPSPLTSSSPPPWQIQQWDQQDPHLKAVAGGERAQGTQAGSQTEQPNTEAHPNAPARPSVIAKTEKPARPGQCDVGRSPLQAATASLFVPGFILTCGSTSTWSQGTQPGQPWPRTQPPTSPLTAQFPTLQQRGKQEYP